MDPKMTVSVNGELKIRRIVAYETNRDISMPLLGLEAMDLPVVYARPVPETYEHEIVEWVMGSDVPLIIEVR